MEKRSTVFSDALGQLTVEELNSKPNATTWSVGQVIDHIIKVNESYYPIVEQLWAGIRHNRGARAAALQPSQRNSGFFEKN
ncbi:MAG: DinB family protein [Bacteroidetes bacterium]|nr:DinB family protein [Bacteroidota bacterium]